MTSSALSYEDALAQAASFIEARRAKHAGFRMDAGDSGGDAAADNGSDAGTADDGQAEPTAEERLAALEAELSTWKANARKHEDRAKANKDAAAELARLKAANATPDERLAAAEKVAADAALELARYKVAAETGVPASLLHGNDEDAMREAAKAALAFRGEPKKTAPKPDPTQGSGGDGKRLTGRDAGRAEAERRFGKKN